MAAAASARGWHDSAQNPTPLSLWSDRFDFFLVPFLIGLGLGLLIESFLFGGSLGRYVLVASLQGTMDLRDTF